MLHITNGDSAALQIAAAEIKGEILPWRDILHEGPVPQGLSLVELSEVRANFIAGNGWGTPVEVRADFARRDAALEASRGEDEIVLWFEHDLYDQIQLLQVLDWFSARPFEPTRLTLVCEEEYLGDISGERARELYLRRSEVERSQLYAARSAWAAFRSPNPTSVARVAEAGLPELPFVTDAFVRHLEQFPSLRTGLSRSERQALEVVDRGRSTVGDAFVASTHEMEERLFCGDAVFFMYLERLSTGDRPLLVDEDGGALVSPGDGDEFSAFIRRKMRVTDDGYRVLSGELDWPSIRKMDRWLGGVHLAGHKPAWRWDESVRCLIPAGFDRNSPQ